MATTKYHRPSGSNNGCYFSWFWRWGESEMKVLGGFHSWSEPLCGLQMVTFLLLADTAFPWCVCVKAVVPLPLLIRTRILLYQGPIL